MSGFKLPSPPEMDRILRFVNFGHAGLAGLCVAALASALITRAGSEIVFGCALATAVFAGLYVYTASVRHTICRMPVDDAETVPATHSEDDEDED